MYPTICCLQNIIIRTKDLQKNTFLQFKKISEFYRKYNVIGNSTVKMERFN